MNIIENEKYLKKKKRFNIKTCKNKILILLIIFNILPLNRPHPERKHLDPVKSWVEGTAIAAMFPPNDKDCDNSNRAMSFGYPAALPL